MSYFTDKGIYAARALEVRKTDLSSSEIAKLRKMAAQGFCAGDVAKEIGGITEGAVRHRAKNLGISFRGCRKSHFGVPVSHPDFKEPI